jgi:PAS domain S-box-containing protein
MVKDKLRIDLLNPALPVDTVKDHAIFTIDTYGNIISWNADAEQICGYTESEAMGMPIAIFYTTEEIVNGEPGRNLEMAQSIGHFEDEGWRVCKDGSVFWANVVFTALKDTNGNLLGFCKVISNLTRRRRLEEAVKNLNKELEEQLKISQSEILDYKHAIDEAAIVAITDQKGIITYVNDNFCKISKYSKDELVGQDHRIINSGYHSKEFIRHLWTTVASGEIWRGELKNKAKDGTTYWVDTTIVPFLNKKGKPFQYLAIRSDITQRKFAEDNVYKINEELERKIEERTFALSEALEREKELGDMKSRFVSIASHEFRTPLTTILSSVSLIEQYKATEQEEKQSKHINRIKSSVKNLTEILDDFLSLDKLEQGRVEVKCNHFILDEFILCITEEMEGMLKKKDQKIICLFDASLEMYQDKKILRNVLFNLLSNAIKYSPSGRKIQLISSVEDENVLIAIKDDGIGIPLEAQKALFSKFFRANNAINIQGTGLGLNIVKRYMELLGGHISFTSQENEGSTFTISFPRIKF